MAKSEGKKKLTHDRWFIIVSTLLVILIGALSIYSIVFISNNLLGALSTKSDQAGDVRFDLEKYEELSESLDLN